MGFQWAYAMSVERQFALFASFAALFSHVQMEADCDKLSWRICHEVGGPCEEAGGSCRLRGANSSATRHVGVKGTGRRSVPHWQKKGRTQVGSQRAFNVDPQETARWPA